MREIDVGMAVIVDVNKYLLERRTDKTSNGALDKIACLGGGVEEKDRKADEDYPERRAAWREVTEEETFGLEGFKPHDFRFKDKIKVISDRDGKPVRITAFVYELLLPHKWEVKPQPPERQLVWLNMAEIAIARSKDELSPATGAAFKEIYEI